MATRLKNLHVKKVDFVDEGANQRADVKLYKRKEPEGDPEIQVSEPEQASVLKKLMTAIGKALGFGDADLDFIHGRQEDGTVLKGNSQTFSDKMTEVKRQKVADEIWNVCYALQSSLQSIIYDDELDKDAAKSMMEQSISDFGEIIAESVDSWSNGKSCGIRKSMDESGIETMKKYREKLDSEIQKALEKQKGETDDMLKIDKSKMTPEERAAYDAIITKYAVDTGDGTIEKAGSVKPGENGEEEEIEETGKGCGAGEKKTKPTAKSISAEEGEDIYKGLHPAVAEELRSLRKRADEADEKELMEVAKKYAVIGKKPEELVPTLKSLKDAGGTAYADMLGVLDSAVAMAESSGVFSEVGKSGRGISGAAIAKSSSEAKVDSIAKGYMEKDPDLSYIEAVAKAWENNPDLIDSYEEEAGF